MSQEASGQDKERGASTRIRGEGEDLRAKGKAVQQACNGYADTLDLLAALRGENFKPEYLTIYVSLSDAKTQRLCLRGTQFNILRELVIRHVQHLAADEMAALKKQGVTFLEDVL